MTHQNPYKLGYWICNGLRFTAKHLAAIYASSKNLDYHYVFNDEELSQYHWDIEPSLSIDELYLQRAQQLRDRYDYLILFYSGGADSRNILQTFLKNHILINEVISWGAWNHKIDKHNHLLNSEIFYAGSDDIKASIDAGYKFTHINYLDIIDQTFTDSDWYLFSDWRMTPESEFRRRIFYHRPEIQKIVDRGRSVGLIFGRDKPRILYQDNALWSTTIDITTSQDLYPEIFNNDFYGPSTEWFYHSPDLPELMIKQSHLVANWYLQNHNQEDVKILLHPSSYDKNYGEKINFVVYPSTWHKNIFSVGKGSRSMIEPFYHKGSFFFDSLKDTDVYNVWMQGIKKVYSDIDEVFKCKTGIVGKFSKLHLIKKI